MSRSLLRHFRRFATAFAFVGTFALSTGCAQPVEVDGETLGDSFPIRDVSPQVKGSDTSRQLVFSDDDGEVLRTLALKFGDLSTLEVGVELPLSADVPPTAEATVGDLVEFTRTDGVVVKSSENFRTAVSVGGVMVLEQVEPFYAGTFTAEMDDGGTLSGSFVVVP